MKSRRTPTARFAEVAPPITRKLHAFPEQTWYLTADITCWPGLMPHILAVHVLATHCDRTLARIEARLGWLPLVFECGFAHDAQHMVLQRWYRGALGGGIVERWQVQALDDEWVELSYTLSARGWWKRILARLVIAPLARRQAEMIELLAGAHREAQETDGW